jgi:hypothetical protein
MAEIPFEEMTLREKFKLGGVVVRELIEHLEQGFSPKVRELERIVRPADGSSTYHIDEDGMVTDVTVRHQTAELLESEDFTDGLFERTFRLLAAIDHEVAGIL